MKLQHIAAAVALIAAGAANAAVDGGNTLLPGQTTATVGAGNGSLVLVAYDKLGGTTTAGVFDLGIRLNDFVGATGNGSGFAAGSLALTAQNIQWNFNTNTLSINGVVTSAYGNNDWTGAWNRLLANSDAADLQFIVTAFDTQGIGANVRSLVTGVVDPTSAQLNNSASQVSTTQAIAGGKANDIFLPLNGGVLPAKGTIASADNGAYTFTADDGATTRANGYFMAGDAFANNWRNGNLLNGETFADNEAALWLLDGLRNETAAPGRVKLNATNGTLTITAVPEPSTYAMVLTGLAVAGAVAARRRRA